jgi:20S proteasome alpha/beta subunit
MLPFVAYIYEKLDFDNYRKSITKKDAETVGMEAFKYIFKNSVKCKEEFFNIVAIMDDKTVEEIKEQPFTKTIMTIKEIFTDKELTSFFKQAMG